MVIAVVLDSTGERQACDVPCLAGLDGTVRRQTERFLFFCLVGTWDMWMTRDMKRKSARRREDGPRCSADMRRDVLCGSDLMRVSTATSASNGEAHVAAR